MRILGPRPVFFGLTFSVWLFTIFLALTMFATNLAGPVRAAVSDKHWPACAGTPAMQKISFVHVSDMHARYNPEAGGQTPVGRIRGFYEAVKKENPYTVFTGGGDDYEKGSVAEEFSRGGSTREVVQALAYDVRTIGNHDFAWGLEELLRFADDPRAVVLSANSRLLGGDESKKDKQPWQEYAELQAGCVKIGFFGLTTRPYDAAGRQIDGPTYPEVPALVSDYDHLSIARRIINEHRDQVDLLVLVSHLGITDDIRIAEATDGIDLILGGHSHTVLEESVQVKGTRIVHAGANAEFIGRIDLHFDLNSRSVADSSYLLVENLPGVTPANESLDRTVAHILHRYREEIEEPVASVTKELHRPEIAEIAALAATSRPGVDAAFVAPSSVWQDNWRGGSLSRQDLLDTFKVEREPVGTTGTSSLYLMRVKGADLLLARRVLREFAYAGPEGIKAENFYTVAMQKAQAIRQESLFGRTISLLPPQPLAELWQAVAAFGRDRWLKGLTLDGEVATLPVGTAQSLFAGTGKVPPHDSAAGHQPSS